MLTAHPKGTFPTFEFASASALSVSLQAKIDTLWQSALRDHPSLFDGPILGVVDFSADRFVLARASYRHLIAARRDPAVRQALGLRPLAVSGILSCADGLVFGRRAKTVTQGPGLWELAPSGGMDAPTDGSMPDLSAQILKETREEIGLTPDQVSVLAPIGVIDDDESGVVDVILPLTTTLSAAEIKGAHATHGSAEYDVLHITSSPHDFIRDRDDVLSASRITLDAFVERTSATHAGERGK